MSTGRHSAGARRAARRRPRLRHLVLVAGITTGTALVGGAATALWSDGLDATATVSGSQVGVQLSRLGTTTSTQTATGAGSVLTASTVRADAQTMTTATPRAVAIPLAVRLRADGNAGLRYTLALSTPAAGSVFAASTLRLFPVADAASCTATAVVTAAGAAQPSTTSLVGLAAGSGAPATTTLTWCLGALYPDTGGRYTNTATASTTVSGTAVTASASWSAYVYAPVQVSLTHTLTTPAAP